MKESMRGRTGAPRLFVQHASFHEQGDAGCALPFPREARKLLAFG